VKQSRVNDYLEHMLEAIQLASSYVDGLDEPGFLADRRTQQAVILNIVVLGEAATKLANDHPAFVALHPDVPWQSMRGMRNRMAHGYFDIDLAIVWQTVKSSLPSLAERLAAIRDGVSGSGGPSRDGA
jgi:uncharacterized protein with HEPN domain